MKQKVIFIFTSLFLVLIGADSVYAQAFPEFTLSTTATESGITLNTDSPLVNKYALDISDKNWPETQAIYVANLLDEKSALITLETDFANQKIILILDTATPTTKSWNVHDWNIYLKSIF